MLKQLFAGAVAAAALSLTGIASAQTPSAADTIGTKPNDYADPKAWLCRPGAHDACDVDETTTVVAADGTLTRETWKADPNAPIDCFYVYPTVSTDTTPNSDMIPDPAETNVIKQQFARFASRCRVYAPMYRQITLVGLRRMLAAPGGATPAFGDGVQYNDVRDAWHYYLEHDNKGRGVVLVAHSQGSFILIDLIRREIDGKPVQSKIVSAMLMGTTVAVPKGKDVGGTFAHFPLCHSASQTGCLITFASFRSTVPPPANTLFGKVPEADMVAACVNPAALAGGGELHAYLSNDGRTITGTSKPKPWVDPGPPVETPWVSVPGLLTAKCASNENASGYLEITVHGDPADPRVDDIVGDLGVGTNVLANWGLHLVDVNMTMGNLLDVVASESKAYTSKK